MYLLIDYRAKVLVLRREIKFIMPGDIDKPGTPFFHSKIKLVPSLIRAKSKESVMIEIEGFLPDIKIPES